MGLDMTYQALPATCDVLDRARQADDAFGEAFALIPGWFRDRAGRRPWPAFDALQQELRALARRHPGLDRRRCSLDRWWDLLHFLLSATRRGQPAAAADRLFDLAVRGGDPVAEHVRAGQGIPVRIIGPAEVAAIAGLLGPLTVAHLRDVYAPAAMAAAGVYKFAAGREERDWTYLPRYFEAFRRFYLDVAGRDEIVLVHLD